ncbi:MAG: hypothetical protein FJZ96_14885 [Chloroflexi bacterium]|nr:hypothetical protein [Chloroflexota bacterium]
MPHRFLKVAVFVLRLLGRDPRRFGKNADIDLAAIASVDFPVHARVDIRPVMAKKDAASACHSSQGGGMRRGLAGWLLSIFGASETYMRIHPPVSKRERIARDLFQDFLEPVVRGSGRV